MRSSHWQERWSGRLDPFREECRQARRRLLADLEDPHAAQARVLEDIVALCSDSLHWKENGYHGVAPDPDQLRARLPIMRYDDFAPQITRESHTKGGTLSCSPVLRWLKTSGTTGTPKQVPYTLHWLMTYRVPAMRAMWGTYLEYHPEILAHPHATLDTQTVHEQVDAYVHGVHYQAISNRHPRVNSTDWNPPWSGAPWFGPDVPSSHTARMYHRIRHLAGQDLHFVSAINPSTLISLRDLVAEHGEAVARDVADGTLEGRPYGPPDPRAAARLRAAVGRDDFALTDVWPSLKVYSCWTSASAGLYQSALDAALPGLDVMPFMSCGTEGVTTIPVDDTPDSQPLAIGQAFFEFVPADIDLGARLDAGDHVDTLLFDELTPGCDYHLIMTQGNGLYRLWSGDVYRVDRMAGGVPWIHFVNRAGVFHSFTGEKITEAQVTEAVERALADEGLTAGLYLCGPQWGSPPYYVMAGEVPRPGPELDRRLSEAVDRALQVVNIEYAAKRGSDRLGPLRLFTVAGDTIAAYSEGRRQPGNSTQYKFTPFVHDTGFLADLLGGDVPDAAEVLR